MTNPKTPAGLLQSGVYTNVEDLLKLRYLAHGLSLEARQQSQALLEGAVRTRYRGRGMEFAEVRPYQPGDDIRTIDWRVTARMQAPYTKLFQEEHERPVFVLVDQRSNMFFGSRYQFKSVFAARIAALIAWIANQNNDRIGAMVFGDENQQDIRARRGKHAVLDLINQLQDGNRALRSPIKSPNAIPLATMLLETSRIARPGSLIVLISDFHDYDESCREPLSMIGRRSDVLGIHIYDSLEKQLPPNALLPISNQEQRLTINTRELGSSFADAFNQHQSTLRKALISSGIQYVHAPVCESLEAFARDLFSSRQPGRPRRGGTR